MADADRVIIPVQEIAPGSSDINITWTAGDSVNGHYFLNDGHCALIMTSSAGSKTATVVSVANANGRTGNISMAPSAGNQASSGFLKPNLFNQTSALYLGRVFVNIDSATGVNFAVVRYAP